MNRINPFRATLLKYFKSNSSKYLSKETSLTFEKFCEEQAEKLDKEDDEKVQRAQRYIDEYLIYKDSIVNEEEIIERNGCNVDETDQDRLEKLANNCGLTIRRT